MSRCFAYPPPGYTPSRGTNEALIDSIKLQKEEVEKAKVEKALADQAKADRKREKKEKKEKKREKKEKKKLKEEGKAKQSKWIQSHQDVHGGKTSEHSTLPQKLIKDDTEQLEKSNITEEHGEPTQVPSYSSDSTQSGKRKRPADSPANATRAPGGNILRIRLPSQKNMKHEITRSNVVEQQPAENLERDAGGSRPLSSRPHEAQNQANFETRGREPCSTSGSKDVSAEQAVSLRRVDNGAAVPLRPDQKLKFNEPRAEPLRPDQKLKFIAPAPATIPVTRHDVTSHVEYIHSDESSKEFKKKRKVADKYRDLIENWNPSSLMSMDTEDDDDWLSKKTANRPEKVAASTEMSCSSSTSLWPQAHFLPDANIYAMPYAIPF